MIQVPDLLAIKFYTDLDDEQYEFRKSFRKENDNEADKDIIRRHTFKYYHWGKWLNHAITVYGHRINNDAPITYYHGLSDRFMFSSLKRDFNIPTSLTTDIAVAQTFATFDGIIMQLKCQWDYESQWNRSKALSVEWISQFPDEKEVLLFGNFNQLVICNIIVMKEDYNTQTKKLVQAIYNFEKICDGNADEIEKKQDDVIHANILKGLIKNEITGHLWEDYVTQLFHNICKQREQVLLSSFGAYLTKWQEVFNDDEMFNDLNDVRLICDANGCYSRLTPVGDGRKQRCECGNSGAILVCSGDRCKYGLCNGCVNGLKIIKRILPNSILIKDKIANMNVIKFSALQIELLQANKLF